MYLSRLLIKNYKSIKELDLGFGKGKNVIVGRNNAGKSNIVKAIDLILGESSPTYEKSENITDNDFFMSNTSEPIYIFCELTRDTDEDLNYDEIYKCYGMKVYAEITGWEQLPTGKKKPIKQAIRISLSRDNLNNFFKQFESLFEIADDNNYQYVDPKLRNQKTFEKEFKDKHQFAFAFRAYKDEHGLIHKDIRFLYREDNQEDWVMAFSAPIRGALLQSAIIPSFRDPQIQLRISNWGWYGKLLKTYINPSNQKLLDAFSQVKDASNEVFVTLQQKINDAKIKVAFPNTTISFQFNPDVKQDVHKTALIYVNDGFNSQLSEKGSGIQSAIIIGLFDFYTREVANPGCCLLVVEEPELYLHPHGRRVISDRLDDFLDNGKNQVIITTHSSEFIAKASQQNLNIIVVKKDSSSNTTAVNTSFDDPKERRVLLKTQNAEMFFADYVLLTEGGDKYLVEAIARSYGNKFPDELGPNWLNNFNISVLDIGGKGEFAKYVKKLKEINIAYYVLSDFDFLRDGLSEYLTELSFEGTLKQKLNELKGKIGAKYGNGYKSIDVIKDDELKRQTVTMLAELKKHKIFILQHELEMYFTDLGKSRITHARGKEEKAITLAAEIYNSQNTKTSDFIKEDEYEEFLSSLKDDIPIPEQQETIVTEKIIVEEVITTSPPILQEEAVEEIPDDIPF